MEDTDAANAVHSDVEEDDPGRLLNAWLGELDSLKKVMLTSFESAGVMRKLTFCIQVRLATGLLFTSQ